MNPFPGLRPFRDDEEAYYFGREQQVDVVVDLLAAERFLAVVGTSGSGKSSLVTCGLIPALHRGLLGRAGTAWRVARLTPGNRPLRALAEALAGVLGSAEPDESPFTPSELMEATLRLSKLGIVDAFRQSADAGRNLLLFVDQFEELFRYRALNGASRPEAPGAVERTAEDATAFVNLLLELRAHPELPIEVVLTMRSDFLGDAAQFYGLPEAINRGQYLVPRLSRDERRAAIAGPVLVGGAEIDPVLLTRLVNDVGDNPDQLSLLQHALRRTWGRWQQDGGVGPLELSHYEAVGTMARALNQHAEEAYTQLPAGRSGKLAQSLFQAITDKTSDARGTRRPTRLDTLAAITGAGEDELIAVIDVFRDAERSFLMPQAGTPLRPDTPIDISHESLMRTWDRLRAWADEEAQSAQTFRRLAETAELHLAGRAALLRQPDLQFALDWVERQRPTEVWASRIRDGLPAMLAFIDASRSAFERAIEQSERDAALQLAAVKRAQLRRRSVLLVGLALALGGLLSILFFRLREDADRQVRDAQVDLREAERARQTALESALSASRARQQQQAVYDVAVRENPQLGNAVAKAQATLANASLVYLQYADAAQAAFIGRLQAQLQKAGYSAPGSERVVVAPARAELRYFRPEDAADATTLADELARWKLGVARPMLVPGYEAQAKSRQFELWMARPDPADVAQLLQRIDAPTPEERKAAAQQLLDRYAAAPTAIAAAVARLEPGRAGASTSSGRINTLFFLTRTAPLAWDPATAARARELLDESSRRSDIGEQTRSEMVRLARLLDAVEAGPLPPA